MPVPFRNIPRLPSTLCLLLALAANALLTTAVCAAPPADLPTLQDAVPLQDIIPAGRPPLQYVYTPADAGPVELTMQLQPDARNLFPAFLIQIMRGRQLLYTYHLDTALSDYLLFPVLDPGPHQIIVRGYVPGTPFTLQMRRITPQLTADDKAAALKAIDQGTALLLKSAPGKTPGNPALTLAVESLAMAALDSDPDHSHQQVIENDYLPWMAQQFHELPTIQWNGQNISGPIRAGSPMYCNALATLALAEMAPHEPAAKDLATQGANYILAAQLTDRRPSAWRAIPATNPNFGGWRYQPFSADADISVSGWCVIALNACAVADIQPDGTRDALRDAVAFIKRSSTPAGFSYLINGSGGTGPIRNAIGALIFALDGEHGPQFDAAIANLDHHLFAGTQVDDGPDYALYYAYYATRLHYLRGGPPWETWRATAIRQLVKLQTPDGSWPAFHDEAAISPQRYPTALSILILRMCLNDEPAYLTQEVRGF
jgi:hypothetical protein